MGEAVCGQGRGPGAASAETSPPLSLSLRLAPFPSPSLLQALPLSIPLPPFPSPLSFSASPFSLPLLSFPLRASLLLSSSFSLAPAASASAASRAPCRRARGVCGLCRWHDRYGQNPRQSNRRGACGLRLRGTETPCVTGRGVGLSPDSRGPHPCSESRPASLRPHHLPPPPGTCVLAAADRGGAAAAREAERRLVEFAHP